MKLNSVAVTALTVAVVSFVGLNSALAQCNFFLLKEFRGDVILECVVLADGETRIFTEPDVITFIFPFGPGQSGDLVQRSQGRFAFTVHNSGDELRASVRRPDGTERALPPVKIADLRNYDIRVNVTGASGVRKAFVIEGNADYRVDDGPVIDMFGGKIVMQDGDYSITTEVKIPEELSEVHGEVPLEYVGGLLYAKVSITGGKTAYCHMEFGAGGTVVTKSFLPRGTRIEALKALEYSDKGVRELSGTMGATGGDVAGFLGRATLKELRAGSLKFRDVRVNVVERMPDFGYRNVAGIIGIDLLGRADVVSYGYRNNQQSSLRLTNLSELKRRYGVIELPFSRAVGHLFVRGSVDGVPLSFLFDSGARNSIITKNLAKTARLRLNPKESMQFRGLDGNPIESNTVDVGDMRLGRHSFENVKLFAADLAVMRSLGLKKDGSLLGNDFLHQFDQVEVDFRSKMIRLLKHR